MAKLSWESLAEKALSLSFDAHGKKDSKKSFNYNLSKSFLELSMRTADKAWPFLKYCDLCQEDDYELLFDVCKKSFFVEKTECACVKLIHLSILLNNLEESKKWLNELILLNPDNSYIKKFEFLKETFFVEGKYVCTLLDNSFDAKSYFELNKKLKIKSELDAILHFILNWVNAPANTPANDSRMSGLLGNIQSYIDGNFLTNSLNALECICLLCTGKEFDDGYFEHFKNQIENTIQSNDYKVLKNIDFKLILKNKRDIDVSFLNPFKSVEIIEIKIPEKYDFYVDIETSSEYGAFSGPNLIFFQTIKSLQKYNTTLLMECDCFLADRWVDRLYDYVKGSGGFWISGSFYDGPNHVGLESLLNLHINGGVCMYKTGDNNFQSFAQFCLDISRMYVKFVDKSMPYDYLIRKIIDYHFNNDLNNRSIWQFIRRQYLHNNLISNYSPIKDSVIENEHIFKRHDCAIIHKKAVG